MCRFHGGSAPQVRDAARRRILGSVGLCIDLLRSHAEGKAYGKDTAKPRPGDQRAAAIFLIEHADKLEQRENGEQQYPGSSLVPTVDLARLSNEQLQQALDLARAIVGEQVIRATTIGGFVPILRSKSTPPIRTVTERDAAIDRDACHRAGIDPDTMIE